jgi:hypothetical protein
MKKLLFIPFFCLILMTGCEEKPVVLDSGTYEGTIKAVVPAKEEIYVQAEAGTLELYFTEETELLRNGQSADFTELAEDQSVRVTVEREGDNMKPVRVVISE